jgi:hypothetical protein
MADAAAPCQHRNSAANQQGAVAAESVPTVLVMTPGEYAAWNSARPPRAVCEVAATEDEEAGSDKADADGGAGEEDDAADEKRPRKSGPPRAAVAEPPREPDKPATLRGVVFTTMAELRGHVRTIVGRGNPLAEEDAAFMVELLRHHPKAKTLFADATEAPTCVLRVVVVVWSWLCDRPTTSCDAFHSRGSRRLWWWAAHC